jgi:hypothetical protein
MRQFFLEYSAQERLQPLVGGIRWSKHLHDARQPIGVATYRIVKKLPKELRGELPSPEQIAALLEKA